jgi:uncharacterized coiled-coil DUF342 family protein
MKSKQEIKKLAKEIAELELKIQTDGLDKTDSSVFRRIETIMESLSLEEGLELNDAVIEILEKS